MVDFWGVVRGEENGDAIEGLDYETNHTMAEHQLNLIAQSAAKDFGLTQVILRHRIGFVRAGEPSLFLRVAAPRRNEAFAASQRIVEELKRRVPIWKRPIFAVPKGSLDRHKETAREGSSHSIA